MPQFQITNPMPGQTDVSSNIVFAWDNNPTNYTYLSVYTYNGDFSYFQGSPLNPATDTSWMPPSPVSGTNTNFIFNVYYQTSASNYLSLSTPTNSSGQALPGWSYTSLLGLTETVSFTLPPLPAPQSGTSHSLVARFTFDDPNNLGTDSSGNGNDYNAGGGQNGASVTGTTDAKVGGGAILFTRNDSDNFSAGYQGWDPVPPAQITSTLAGSYSIAVWVKTTASIGSPGAPGYQASTVIGLTSAAALLIRFPLRLPPAPSPSKPAPATAFPTRQLPPPVPSTTAPIIKSW